VRLFVALDLPANAKQALAGVEADPEIWRRVKAESLHVTLAFLGRRPDEDVETIGPLIDTGLPAPRLTLDRVLLLPPRRPRVRTVELRAEGLAELQARVAGALAAAGVYTPEKRPFRPHVTVGRLRPRAQPPRTADVAFERLTFHGTAVTLYASRLHPHGARYEPLAIAPLAAP
jgi:2'-5' RNA ligase